MGYTSLAGVVAELRRALGEERREPRFLRTVHGHGYAFCGEAEDEPGRSGAAPSPFSCYLLPRASRRHARILVDGRAARIEDLGSKNGTRVREQTLVSPLDLADGDVIEIGGVRLAFRARVGPGSTLTGSA